MTREQTSEFDGPLVCPVCRRIAEGDAWLIHPVYGYRRCPVCLDDGLGSVIPWTPGPKTLAEWNESGTTGW